MTSLTDSQRAELQTATRRLTTKVVALCCLTPVVVGGIGIAFIAPSTTLPILIPIALVALVLVSTAFYIIRIYRQLAPLRRDLTEGLVGIEETFTKTRTRPDGHIEHYVVIAGQTLPVDGASSVYRVFYGPHSRRILEVTITTTL